MVLKVWARTLIVPHGPNTGGVKSSQMNLCSSTAFQIL